MKFCWRTRTITLGFSRYLRFEWGSRHEYWTRYVIGPVYVLVGHSAAYWAAVKAEEQEYLVWERQQ